MNDNKILKDFASEDGLNIEDVIKTYNNYIYTIIKKLITNNEDIEEILSDVFIILWNNYYKLEENTKVKPYLVGITKNLIRKKYRNYNYENIIQNIDETENEIIDNCDVLKLVEENEKSKIISEIIDNMKKEEKQIFIMFYYQNKKIKDIAKNLNISVSKVKITLYRLRNLVKKKFKERGYDYGK